MEKPPVPLDKCPSCLTPCEPGRKVCAVCRHEILPKLFYAEVVPESTGSGGYNTFSLASMFIVVTICAICFAMMRYEPDSGIAMLIVTTMALAATAIVGRRRLRRGCEFGRLDKVRTFFLSFLTVAGLIFTLMLGLWLWLVSLFWDFVISGIMST